MYSKDNIKNAEIIFNYLYMGDSAVEKSDLIVGFGHFDMKIPRQCGLLYKQGLSEKILFSGGVGAGSADLKEPEAVAFKKELLHNLPDLKEEAILIEEKSTNTGENVQFSQRLLEGLDSNFTFSKGIKSVIAVANPCRQKRVYLTLRKHYPALTVYNCPPKADLEGEIQMFGSKGEDFIALLVGELERIINYPEKGFIEYERVPEDVEKAYLELKQEI